MVRRTSGDSPRDAVATGDPVASLPPLARRWFSSAFGAPTPAQRLAWPAIANGGHVMLVAPTGSGKTLAAFLHPLGRLAQLALDAPSAGKDGLREPSLGIRLLYISPLRALDADIHHNLRAPLHGLSVLAREAGRPIHIAHSVRTGDTPQRERRAMIKRPPHVLITTPESLFLLLAHDGMRESLSRVDTVIVDELHAIADSKRGTHLSLTLERLEELTAKPFQRIGLTATAEPLDDLGRLLAGSAASRVVQILDGRAARSIELNVEVVPAVHDGGDPRVRRVAELVGRSERTLVFVGSRMMAERFRPALERELENLLPDARTVGIHHGALARDVRVDVETGLRDGTLRAVVATSSLELGIDIGAIDQVVQVGAPVGSARLLQRLGRAGHRPDAISRGTVISRGGVDLFECAVTAARARTGVLEPVHMPHGALDVLAQQLVAHASAAGADGIAPDDFVALARRSWPYRDLSREQFESVVAALCERSTRGALIDWSADRRRILGTERGRKLVRTASGTITSRGLYRMLDVDSHETIGELDEEFINESSVGDRFTFGLGTYRIVAIRPDAVTVSRVPASRARRPFWRGDRPMRPVALGRAMGEAADAVAKELSGTADDAVVEMLGSRFQLDAVTATSLADVLRAQANATGLPTDRCVVIESFSDQLGEPRVAIHSWIGRPVLEPWAHLLAGEIEKRHGGAVHVVANDNGILLAPSKNVRIDPPALATYVDAETLRARLLELLPRAAIVGAAFREAAERAMLLPRQAFKKRTPLWMSRMRARDMLRSVRDDSRHPMLAEALREVMHDRWDVGALEALLRAIADGAVDIVIASRRTPSPFARALEATLEAENLYEDDTPAGERLAQTALGSGESSFRGTFADPFDVDALIDSSDVVRVIGDATAADLARVVARSEGLVPVALLARSLGVELGRVREMLTAAIERGEIVIARASDPGLDEALAVGAETLARLRRRGLWRARNAIEPVPMRAYQRWLLERHRAGPYAGDGEDAVVQAIRLVSHVPIPPECLERDVLRVRVRRYETSLLDIACARGLVRYVLLQSPARVVVAPTDDLERLPRATNPALDPACARIREVLAAKGASFLADVVVTSSMPVADVHAALAHLLGRGEASNDAFAPARALIESGSLRGSAGGRWALTPNDDLPRDPARLVERLLQRYGVVARSLVDLEELTPAWTEMRTWLDRLEERGDIRRGTIVEGLGAVQFARTEVIDALRSARAQTTHEAVMLSSRDPALVVMPGGVARAASTRVVLLDGDAVLCVERDGRSLRSLRDLDVDAFRACVAAVRSLAKLPANLRPFRSMSVDVVDGVSASSSPVAPLLRAAGFEPDGDAMFLPSFRG